MLGAHRNNVVILTGQRSGSTWLVDLLYHRAPSAKVFSEIFLDRAGEVKKNPDKQAWAHLLPEIGWHEFQETHLGIIPVSSVAKYLKYLSPDGGERLGARGLIFKLMDDRVTINIVTCLIYQRYKLLRLERLNLLEQICSWEQAKLAKVYHSSTPLEVQPRVHLEPADTISKLLRLQRRRRKRAMFFHLWPFAKHCVTYEELSHCTERSMQKLREKLGLPLMRNADQGTLQKLDHRPLRDRIQNYNHIMREIERSQLVDVAFGGRGIRWGA